MDEQIPVMLRLISSAVSIAKRAGDEVRRITKSGRLDVVDKGIRDYQTEADRRAQRMIIASLSKKFNRCAIVGEEDLEENAEIDRTLIVDSFEEEILKLNLPKEYQDVKVDDVTIWVDPLDGTAEFVNGLLEHVTILIGISVSGKAVGGIIHQPFPGYSTGNVSPSGRTLWGLVGLGCFGLTPKQPPNDRLVITTTASHGNKNIEDSITALKPDEVLKVGGAGHKVLLVIEGRAHSYVFTSNGCKRWDTCAPEAILHACGGRLTDSFGGGIEYNYRQDKDYQNRLGIVASINEEIHARVIQGIPEVVKGRLSEVDDKVRKPKF